MSSRLRWTCEACGWSVDINAPGFAGDGRLHYPDGKTPCGPIKAQRAGEPVVIRDATPLQRDSDEFTRGYRQAIEDNA
jgi:hypothetical protein